MAKYLICILALSLVLNVFGCGDDGTDGVLTPQTKEEATWDDSYRRCNPRATDEGEDPWCPLPFDECVLANDERISAVCATPCETIDDCLALDDFRLPPPTFTAELECRHMGDKGYCLLKCSDDSDCDNTSICVDNHCTWPNDY